MKCVDLLPRPLVPPKTRPILARPGAVPSAGQGCAQSCVGAAGPTFPSSPSLPLTSCKSPLLAGNMLFAQSHYHINLAQQSTCTCCAVPSTCSALSRAGPPEIERAIERALVVAITPARCQCRRISQELPLHTVVIDAHRSCPVKASLSNNLGNASKRGKQWDTHAGSRPPLGWPCCLASALFCPSWPSSTPLLEMNRPICRSIATRVYASALTTRVEI